LTQPYLGDPVPNAGTKGIVAPRPRGRHSASYPDVARRANMEGNVVVAYIINEDGDVTDVRLKRSSGFPVLDEAACSAVWGFRYTPASRDGVLTPVRELVQLRFQLRDRRQSPQLQSWLTIATLCAALLAGMVVFAYFRLRNVGTPSRVKVSQVLEVVRQLQVTGAESSFVVFMFDPSGAVANGDTAVNLQYSVEKGRLGLDWVLLSPPNIADKADLVEFASAHQHQLLPREENGVHYLRVEDDAIASFGMQILTEFYHLGLDRDLDLIVAGFQLKGIGGGSP
jgi:TonB family protein